RVELAAQRPRGLAPFDHAEGAALQLAAQKVSLPLERLEMIVDAVGGADSEVLADLADGGRITLVLDAPFDEGEDLLLAFGERLVHRPLLAAAQPTERTRTGQVFSDPRSSRRRTSPRSVALEKGLCKSASAPVESCSVYPVMKRTRVLARRARPRAATAGPATPGTTMPGRRRWIPPPCSSTRLRPSAPSRASST